MLRSDIEKLFNEYLYRNPSNEEVERFSAYTYRNLEKELAVCEERMEIENTPRVAILMSGHPRNLKMVDSLKKLDSKFVDVFVFAWDQWGHRLTETDLTQYSDKENIENIIKDIPGIKAYKIESNANYVKRNDDKTIKYINWIRDAEVFVKSQLYAIYKSYELMEDYMKKTGVKYDLVIKCRFENSIVKFDTNKELIRDISENKIIFVPDGNSHHHPFPSYCTICQRAYEMGYKHKHIFSHSNPICDLYAYGSVESMKDYCSLIHQYDDLCKQFEEHNMKMMSILKSPHTKRGEAFIIEKNDETHLETELFYFSSYPERLFSYMLDDYMLLRAQRVVLGWQA